MKRKLASMTAIMTVALAVAAVYTGQAATPWKAPESAGQVKNPFADSAGSIEKGRKIFSQQCVPCHGEKGRGDGPAGKYLGTPLPDFTSARVHEQTDGELFWKISTGKSPMPTFKGILSDEQRWLVIRYLRTFGSEQHTSNR